jgi:cytoskeletal protein CcmA (bactofilin family)
MFRRKKDNEDEMRGLVPEVDSANEARNAPRLSPTPPAVSTPIPARPSAPVAAARPAGIAPGAAAAPAAPVTAPAAAPAGAPATRSTDVEGKKLIVGRDIMLSGKITSCDKLVVEGRVEADLSETRAIDISPEGVFKGNAEIESAEIAGRFEGTVTVRQRLFIRSTGKVIGTIRYGTVEIEAGGEISGDIQVFGGKNGD